MVDIFSILQMEILKLKEVSSLCKITKHIGSILVELEFIVVSGSKISFKLFYCLDELDENQLFTLLGTKFTVNH